MIVWDIILTHKSHAFMHKNSTSNPANVLHLMPYENINWFTCLAEYWLSSQWWMHTQRQDWDLLGLGASLLMNDTSTLAAAPVFVAITHTQPSPKEGCKSWLISPDIVSGTKKEIAVGVSQSQTQSKPSDTGQAKKADVSSAARKGTAKISYRGVRQRPWGAVFRWELHYQSIGHFSLDGSILHNLFKQSEQGRYRHPTYW